MAILPKPIYRFSASPIKIPTIFHRTRTNNSKTCWKQKGPKQPKQFWRCDVPISNYTTKLQSLKQYGTGTKIDTLIEQNRESKDKPIFMWSI